MLPDFHYHVGQLASRVEEYGRRLSRYYLPLLRRQRRGRPRLQNTSTWQDVQKVVALFNSGRSVIQIISQWDGDRVLTERTVRSWLQRSRELPADF
jgi:hypothetical protein